MSLEQNIATAQKSLTGRPSKQTSDSDRAAQKVYLGGLRRAAEQEEKYAKHKKS